MIIERLIIERIWIDEAELEQLNLNKFDDKSCLKSDLIKNKIRKFKDWMVEGLREGIEI